MSDQSRNFARLFPCLLADIIIVAICPGCNRGRLPCYTLVLMLFIPIYLKNRVITVPCFLADRFGPVAYSIVSHVNEGYIEASIEPPKRNPPKQIVIRIRHPEGNAMKSVTVDGKAHADFDQATETIRFAPTSQTIEVRAEY